jgi:hypothetical protein
MPEFMPRPPVGGKRWAASPARNTLVDAEAVGDLGGHSPRADGADLDRDVRVAEGGADAGAHDVRGDVGDLLVRGGDDAVKDPALLDVVGDEHAGGLGGEGEVELAAGLHDGAEVGLEVGADEVAELLGADHRDAEGGAAAARGAVGGDDPAAADLQGQAAGGVLHGADDLVGGLRERAPLVAVADVDPRVGRDVTGEDPLELDLRKI